MLQFLKLFYRKPSPGSAPYYFPALLVLISAYIHFPYISGKELFIFSGIGSDTLYQFWPYMHNIFELVHDYHEYPFYSFQLGPGNNVFPPRWPEFHLILLPASMIFGEQMIDYGLGALQFSKPIIAGLFFRSFLLRNNLAEKAAASGGLFYAFSTNIINRSTWYHYADEAVLLAVLLFAYEEFEKKGRSILLIFSVLFIFLLGPSFAYTNTILIFIYLVFRLFISEKLTFGEKAMKFGHAAVVYIVILFLSAFSFLPGLHRMLTSYRAAYQTDNPSSIVSEFTHMENPDVILTGLLKTFSFNIFGTANDYHGLVNVLEDPAFYAGIPALLFIPILLFSRNETRKVRNYLLTFLFAFIAFMAIPGIRHVLSGVEARYFKLNSVWVMPILSFITAYGMDRLLKDKIDKRSILAGIIPIILFGFLVYIASFFNVEVLKPERDRIIILSVIYLILMTTFVYARETPRKNIIFTIMFIFFIYETGMESKFVLQNGRVPISANLLTSNNAYFDATRSIHEQLQKSDFDFFRMEKDFSSIPTRSSANEAQFQGYRGLRVYEGVMNHTVGDFYREMKIETPNYGKKLYGFNERYQLMGLMGVKYYLSQTSKEIPDHKYLFSRDRIHVHQNLTYVAIGTVFHGCLTPDQFKEKPEGLKDSLLLTQLVLNEQEQLRDSDFCMPRRKNNAKRDRVFWVYRDSDSLSGFLNVTDTGILLLQIPMDSGWEFAINGSPTKPFLVDYGLMAIPVDSGYKFITMNYYPPLLRTGTFLTLLGLLGLAGLAYMERRHR